MTDVVNVRLLVETYVTLFVIMDPPGTVPIFLGLTATMNRPSRARAARQAIAVALVVIVVFAVFGQRILDYLHITLPALQAAGGLLLLLIALELLTGKGSDPQASTEVNIALVPLGTPLMAGPGAIVATMVFVNRADRLADYLAVALGILLIHLTMYLFLRFAGVIHGLIGTGGVTLVSRIAGLLLSAIAVQLVVDAARAFTETG